MTASSSRPRPPLPETVAALCATFLDAIDADRPGLVTGLYVRGGVAFGEFVPGQSDVDVVVTLDRHPAGEEVAALAAAHRRTREAYPDQDLDGMHLRAADLAAPPAHCPDVPCVMHGHFDPAARADLNPVAWHELAQHGVVVRGAPVADLDVWTDDAALRDFTRENLDTYWRDSAEALARFPGEAAGDTACVWSVLGVARLHHLLVTGRQTSKNGAGHWALTHYDARFQPVIREALRLRNDPDAPGEYADDPAHRGADVAAFTAHVVAAGTVA